MPVYDYKCYGCDHVFEETKKIADRDDTNGMSCPNCSTADDPSSGKIERLVGSPLVAYSIATAGYGRGAGDGWKEVLQKIHARAPDSQMDKTSSFM